MKRIIVISCILIMILSRALWADNSGFGIGFIIGEPTGISLKGWLNADSALDFAVAWSFIGRDSLHFHLDYLLHNFDLFKVEKGKFPIYYGIGSRIKLEEDDDNSRWDRKGRVREDDNDTWIGIRVPVGLAYLFEGVPLDIFIEIVPILDLVHETSFDLNAALGVRFFFK